MQHSTTIISDLKKAIMDENRPLFANIKADKRIPMDNRMATSELHEHIIDFILSGVDIQKVQEVGLDLSAEALNGQVLTVMEKVLELVS
jgi:hypothetical protein